MESLTPDQMLDRAEDWLKEAEDSHRLRYSSEPTGELATEIAKGWIMLAEVRRSFELIAESQ